MIKLILVDDVAAIVGDMTDPAAATTLNVEAQDSLWRLRTLSDVGDDTPRIVLTIDGIDYVLVKPSDPAHDAGASAS